MGGNTADCPNDPAQEPPSKTSASDSCFQPPSNRRSYPESSARAIQAALPAVVRHSLVAREILRLETYKSRTSRPVISKFFLYGAAFHIWSTFILSRFDDDDAHDDANASPESSPDSDRASGISSGNYELVDEEDEEDEEALFVPLTWSWMQEGELYTASDPEWQEFVRISQDRSMLTKLRCQSMCWILFE